MKTILKASGLLIASTLMASCSGGATGSCSGIELDVQPYGLPTNVHLYVKNSSDEPRLVRLDVVDPDGNVTDRAVVSVPAGGIGEDKSGTYLPQGHEVVISSCE